MDWDPARFYGRPWWETLVPRRSEEPEPIDAWINPGEAIAWGIECNSPIEVRFASQLSKNCPANYWIEAQYRWRGWLMDFAIVGPNGVVAFVECDGARFHSTRDQIENDRRKDAAAREAGIRMFRFTGSQIYKTAAECAAQVWMGIK